MFLGGGLSSSLLTALAGKIRGGVLISDGDSMAMGSHATAGNEYPTVMNRALAAYGAIYTMTNVAQGGESFAGMRVLGATAVDPLYDPTKRQNILCAWGGTNDIWTSTLVTTIMSDITTYCTARKAKGWQTVILTILPRSSTSTPGTFEVDRQTMNAWIRANYRSFGAAGLADVAADPRIGDAGDELDLTYYFTDKCHMNDTGYALIADLVLPVVWSL